MERALLPWHPKQQESEESQKLYFNIESEQHGVLYRIKLKRNQNLFSKKVSQSLHYRQQDLYCLFSGVIVGDSTSTVGMNLCTGMVGTLQYCLKIPRLSYLECPSCFSWGNSAVEPKPASDLKTV